MCCLKSDELQFVNIFSANKVAILCSVDLLFWSKNKADWAKSGKEAKVRIGL